MGRGSDAICRQFCGDDLEVPARLTETEVDIMMDFGGAIKQSKDYDFAVLGVPFDEKSCFLKGPAKGPQAIREASTGRAINPWTEVGVNLKEDTVMVDLGDVDVSGVFRDVFQRIEEKVLEILKKDAVV